MRHDDSPTNVDDYVGKVGHEKHYIHQTHFSGLDRKLKGELSDKYVWIEVRTGRWKLVRREDVQNAES